MPTYWNPCLVLEINPAEVRTCTGTTQRGKPCGNPNNVSDRRVASSMVGELSRVDIVTQGLSNDTKQLVQQIAGLTLCKKNHRGKQEEDLIRKWFPAMREHIADGRGIIQELEQPLRQPAPRQVPIARHQPPPRERFPVRRAASPPPQREARVDPEPAQRVRERAPAPAPAPRAFVPPRYRHIREEAPAVEEAAGHQRAARLPPRPEVQDDDLVAAPPALPPIRPRQPRPYQGPPVVRIRDQVRNIPVRPLRAAAPIEPQAIPRVEAVNRRPQPAPVDPIRKPLERGCYICYEDFDGPDSAVWCRQCGQNLHVECFRNWSLGKRRENVNCAYCRARWFD